MSEGHNNSENVIIHLTSFCATAICVLAYYSGWISGQLGWWWTVFAMFIIYGGIYSILKH